MNMSLSAFAPENLVSRDGFGSRPVPRQPAYLHTCTQAEPGAYLRDSPRVYNTQRARHNKEDQKYYFSLRGNTLALMFCLLDGRR